MMSASTVQKGIDTLQKVEQDAGIVVDGGAAVAQAGNYFLNVIRNARQGEAKAVFNLLERYIIESTGEELKTKISKLAEKESPYDFYVDGWEHQIGENPLRPICYDLCAQINNITMQCFAESQGKVKSAINKILKEEIKKSPLLIMLMIIKDQLFLLSDGSLDENKLHQLDFLIRFTTKVHMDNALLSKLTKKDGLLRRVLYDTSKVLELQVGPLIQNEINLVSSVHNFGKLLDKSLVLVEQGILFLFYLSSQKDYKYNVTPATFYDGASEEIFGEARASLPVLTIQFILQQSPFAAMFPPMKWGDNNVTASLRQRVTNGLVPNIINEPNPFMVRVGDSHEGVMPIEIARQFTGQANNEGQYLMDILEKKPEHLPAAFRNNAFLKSYFKSFGLLYQLCTIRTCFYRMQRIALLGGNLFAFHADPELVEANLESFEFTIKALTIEFKRLYEIAEHENSKYIEVDAKPKKRRNKEENNYIREMAEWKENFNRAANRHKTCLSMKTSCGKIIGNISNYLKNHNTQDVLRELQDEFVSLRSATIGVLKMSQQAGLIDDKISKMLGELQKREDIILFSDVVTSSSTAQIASSASSSSASQSGFFGASCDLQKRPKLVDDDFKDVEIVEKKLRALMHNEDNTEFCKLISRVLKSEQFRNYNIDEKNKVLYVYAEELAIYDLMNAKIQLKTILEKNPDHQPAKKLLSRVEENISNSVSQSKKF